MSSVWGEVEMPEYSEITYSRHARTRIAKRHIPESDVSLVLRIGDGYPEDDGTWIYSLGHIRVVIVERDDTAHVVTVIRQRSES